MTHANHRRPTRPASPDPGSRVLRAHHPGRALLGLTAAACSLGLLATAGSAAAAGLEQVGGHAPGHTPGHTAGTAPATDTPLTNLDHLNWLGAQVAPPSQSGHTTYQLDSHPDIGVLWVYANAEGNGWRRVGGGTYDPTTNTYGQGAYDADDIARAAVVYLRDWRQTGSPTSREHAYQLLRGLTYLQTDSGPNAGNVVLWMQPDGTLNRTPTPPDDPNPSDAGASFWLARTIWALGEGYAAFAHDDPAFAGFLQQRLQLALSALQREVLDRYGQYLNVDGTRKPAWLIGDGADASAEASLGLAAWTRAGGPPAARTALRQLTDGIAQLAGGDARHWPFGGILPSATSLSMWHGWGAQMPAALATVAPLLNEPQLQAVAARDSFTFDPWLLTSGGPDNGRLPTRIDTSQIAYGADSRVESLIATADAATDPGRRAAALDLAGISAAWFFGANPAGQPMYDPATGATYDGINADGTINHNSGAESTIHGLLTMLALDAHPTVATLARQGQAILRRAGATVLQAEDGSLSGPATVVHPDSLWTGESQYGGTGYVSLGNGGSDTISTHLRRPAIVLPVVDLQPDSTARLQLSARGHQLGTVETGNIGSQGSSPAPGALLPITLTTPLRPGRVALHAATASSHGDRARLDALWLEPLVSRLVIGTTDHGIALLRSAATTARHTTVAVPGHGPATVTSYDGTGQVVHTQVNGGGQRIPVLVPAGGFTLIQR